MNEGLFFIYLVGAVILLLPHFAPRQYFFAVTVPAGFRDSEAARASLRRYYTWACAALAVSWAAGQFLFPRAWGAGAAVIVIWSFQYVRDPDHPAEATPDECWRLGLLTTTLATRPCSFRNAWALGIPSILETASPG